MPGENTLVWFGDQPKVHAQLRLVIGFIARYNWCMRITPQQIQNRERTKRKEVRFMLSYEEQTKKLLSKRDALEKRVREDSAEIDKINAKLNEIQLARVRDTFGLDQKAFFELITQHPEKLLELTAQGAAESNTDTAQDSDALDGQTSFFDKKSNHYSET